MKILPRPEAFAREALILIGGALLAAFILSKFPKVRAYIDTNTKGGGCNCN
ncbi:hypothetical protein RAE21_06390 [Rhodoferax sp. TBRC 17198]|uniref:hypothetical protein n=1 Tax=Rhodoferax potami TaxID=3068338 RepID=UPI0028BE93E6|nr:hypothetical protein [Rhodoferax sp. TBRC 17198]MDT7522040.1 hypothetical protein [Rhodoferax sp. TBRC 17198]